MLSASVLAPVCHGRSDPAPAEQPDAAPGLFERVDPQRLQVIKRLFAALSGGGLLFLARLLAQAQGEPCRGGEPEVAVITVQSLRELASCMRWGYDTTHKYVVLFCALGLLVKRRVGGKVELSVALGRYTPPLSLEALDHLIARSRPKVQSYAKQVRRRYLLLYGNCQHAESPTPPPAESPVSDLDETIQRIREREPSPTKRQALITALLEHLERIRRQVNQEEDPQASTALHLSTGGDGVSKRETRHRAASRQASNVLPKRLPHSRRRMLKTGDVRRTGRTRHSPQNPPVGDTRCKSLPNCLCQMRQTGDVLIHR